MGVPIATDCRQSIAGQRRAGIRHRRGRHACVRESREARGGDQGGSPVAAHASPTVPGPARVPRRSYTGVGARVRSRGAHDACLQSLLFAG